MRDGDKPNPLIGKTVAAVFVAKDKGAIRFDLGDETIIVRADGDCCSHSWIENVQGVEQLIGSPVVSVEDIDMPDLGNGDSECITYYGCKITTRKGFCVIDFRNESNGYYGGWLAWPDAYFYGGVFGQNASAQEWEPVS